MTPMICLIVLSDAYDIPNRTIAIIDIRLLYFPLAYSKPRQLYALLSNNDSQATMNQ